jgi:hypothetical protein
MLPPLVIDTNVLIVANGRETHASVACRLASIHKLLEAQAAGRVLIDDDLFILNEYRFYCSYRGQPGVGDAFFRWLWDNQATGEVCRKVPITVDPDDEGTFPSHLTVR